tara:strand:+ start:1087 stop:2139 length:1053 start_codon:yes stop_codon:yes gene_type:complete
MINKKLIPLFFSVLSQGVWAQVFETHLMSISESLPQGITSDRVCVIIDQTPEVENQLLVQKLHLNLRAMGIDAMKYLYYDEFYGGQDVYRKTFAVLQKREIKVLIFLEVSAQEFTLTLARMGTTQSVDFKTKAWQVRGQTINEVLIRLADKMKTLDLPYSNYLIPERPEFNTRIKLFDGTHFPRYPSQLKRFPLVVSLFSPLSIDKNLLNEDQLAYLTKYNERVVKKNTRIQEIFSDYPYKVKFLEDQSDAEFLKNRYQYVLRYAYMPGEELRKSLGYALDATQTQYISTIPVEGNRTLKTMKKQQNVYKFYIQKTANGDLYAGRYYDADDTWEEALYNFKSLMVMQLEK